MRPSMAEVRQITQNPQQVAVAPQVNVAYDDSKLTKLGKNVQYTEKRDGSAKRRVALWGNSYKLADESPGGFNPYASVAYPTVGARPEGPAKNPVRGFEKDYRTVGLDNVKTKPSKAFMKDIMREGYEAGSEQQKFNGALGLSGTAQELAKERADAAAAGGGLMEEDSVEEPDAITVLAVGIASAFVGSATTYVLFHLHRSFTKTEMQAPLLN